MEQFFNFINNSPTAFHAVKNISELLEKEGYHRLDEKKNYLLNNGGKYYVSRNDSSLIAFQIPKKEWKGFSIMASHSDSPCFKLKENPETRGDSFVTLNVEKYGGMIQLGWLDRPLSVAGRVIIKSGEEFVTKLADFNDNACIIPNLAIHLNREINKGTEYNPQKDLQPLWSLDKSSDVMDEVANQLQIKKEEILGSDLYLYNCDKSCYLGKHKELIGAPRLDNLECGYGTLQGFLRGKSEQYCNVYCIFDSEEVGSSTRQGADSDFLYSNLERIASAFGKREELYTMAANSFLISADNAHGIHPNYREKYDTSNAPVLNGGIVIKFHAGQKYTTDAYTAAVVKDICQRSKIPYQVFHNRSDALGGSTLGNISVTHISIPSADIGLAQLAMHSSFETAGSKDFDYLIKFSQEFYSR